MLLIGILNSSRIWVKRGMKSFGSWTLADLVVSVSGSSERASKINMISVAQKKNRTSLMEQDKEGFFYFHFS